MGPTSQPPQDPWEDALTQAFKRLPERPAPATLVPRVKAKVERPRLPRVARISQWPWYSGLAAVAFVTILSVALLSATGVLGAASAWAGTCRTLLSALTKAGTAFQGSGAHLALLYGAFLVIATYLTCIGLGTAVFRVAGRS